MPKTACREDGLRNDAEGCIVAGSSRELRRPSGSPPPSPSHRWAAATPQAHAKLSVRVFANGSATMTQPDDITWLDGAVYVDWQNGIGPSGQPSPTGATASDVVGYNSSGDRVVTWKVAGHADGVTADAATHQLIVTVNEDANSSLFVISTEAPVGHQVQHYNYNLNPLPHRGGTDAVSVYRGSPSFVHLGRNQVRRFCRRI